MDSLLSRRETYGVFKPFVPNEDLMIERLGTTATLEAHEGCVNTLRWNSGGTLLVSGSDDRKLKLWSIDGSLIQSITTGHRGIIFAAEFIPCGGDRIIASGAGDNLAKLHDVEANEVLYTWSCKGRVKRMATAQDEPYMFWSSSEDGTIRQYDVRTNEEHNIIKQDNDMPIKTFAICQGRTELVAVGIEDHRTPIYDRRKLDKPLINLATGDAHVLPTTRIVFTTHLAFNYMGTEIIVNQGCGPIYLYDLNNSESTVLQRIEGVLSNGAEVPTSQRVSENFATVLEEAKRLFVDKNYTKVVELNNSLIAGDSFATSSDKALSYFQRGKAFLARKWAGDTYAAVKDFLEAVRLNPGHSRALWWLSRSLILLEQYSLALRFINLFKERFPNCTSPSITNLEEQVQDGFSQHSETFEFKHDPEFLDYKERFNGHTNSRTDIKEANFFGSRDQYIAAGSDSGCLYIWDRSTGNIKAVFTADEEILNIVQPHPTKFMLATSGIENVVRFWQPLPEDQVESRRVTDIYEMNRFDYSQIAFLGNIAANSIRVLGDMEGAAPCRVA